MSYTGLSYKELQGRAKKWGIRANLKRAEMERLLNLHDDQNEAKKKQKSASSLVEDILGDPMSPVGKAAGKWENEDIAPAVVFHDITQCQQDNEDNDEEEGSDLSEHRSPRGLKLRGKTGTIDFNAFNAASAKRKL